jgi:hypothetical protein
MGGPIPKMGGPISKMGSPVSKMGTIRNALFAFPRTVLL